MSEILNIAIDARPLTAPHCGIGRYTTNLVREFSLLQLPHRFFLYSHRPFQLDFSLPKNWMVRTSKIKSRGLSTAFSQIAFPAWAFVDKIDVFWSPRTHLPLLLPPYIKKIITVHDVVGKRFPETMTRGTYVLDKLLTPLSIRISDRIIADSKFTREEILKFYPCAKDKSYVIYLASSLKSDKKMEICPVPIPFFLFVGSYEPRKNMKRMMQAYVQYRKLSVSPFDLAIVGNDQWGDFNAVDFVQKNNLEACVHLIRNVSDSMLCSLYAHAQALVLVSLYEGFGLPLVEAMQWSVPSIASNTTSVAEVAGNSALLVDPLDVNAIAQAFTKMAEDVFLRSHLAADARIRGQQFSWKQSAIKTMALLNKEV
jgi:glycosyltransferase involved in cell wall biosynthesis